MIASEGVDTLPAPAPVYPACDCGQPDCITAMAQCPQCGGQMQQTPQGGWLCGNCGAQRTTAIGTVTSTTCRRCKCQIDGVNDRYVCGRCGWFSGPGDGEP